MRLEVGQYPTESGVANRPDHRRDAQKTQIPKGCILSTRRLYEQPEASSETTTGGAQMAADFGRRFEELARQAEELESKKIGDTRAFLDASDLLNWKVKARHLISSVCGQESQHFRLFLDTEKYRPMHSTNYDLFKEMKAVLLAAKEDYEGGFLNKLRNLIQAEVFDTQLEQAEELLIAGYEMAAAVVAGVVLETNVRQMCVDRGIGTGKLDKMNADLAKAGAYNSLVQKRVTALAGIRNAAAHGETTAFSKDDVKGMIQEIQRFLAMGTT
jgi:hypothetical protein